MKKILLILLVATVFLTGCDQLNILTGGEDESKEWQLMEESGKDTTVNFLYTRDDVQLRQWVRDHVEPALLESHKVNIEFQYVEFQSIISQLRADKLGEQNYGDIDLLLLFDDELAQLKNEGLLFDDFNDKLPNYSKLMDSNDREVAFNYNTAIEKAGALFGRTQFIFVYDEDELENYPKNTEELLTFCQENPGKFTYPLDEAGDVFIQNIIYDIVGEETLLSLDIKSKGFAEAMVPVKEYLAALKPLMWEKGEIQPMDTAELDELFFDGKVFFSMSKELNHVLEQVENDKYLDGAKSFIFEKGTIGDASYLTIPYNSTNKTGAMIVVDQLLTPAIQKSKINQEGYMSLPSIDLTRLDAEQEEVFGAVPLKRAEFDINGLLTSRYPDLNKNMKRKIKELLGISEMEQ